MNLLNEFLAKLLNEAKSVKSKAAKEAERLGLEKKPGVGLYGPKGKELVTHRSIGGKLVQTKQPELVQTRTPTPKSTEPTVIRKQQKATYIPDQSKITDTALLDKADSREFSSPEVKKRVTLLSDLWKAFLNAPTYEEQVKAVRAMVDYKLINVSINGKKIYIASDLELPYKYLTGSGSDGTKVTRLMNDIIKAEEIEGEPLETSKNSKLADTMGKHAEAGITFYLLDNERNRSDYEALTSEFKGLGGDHDENDTLNRVAADAIKADLPEGAKFTGAIRVGNLGEIKLKEMGIDPKTDPTDLIVNYMVDGKQKIKKYSIKIYTDPNNITMKNSGVQSAGVDYLGEDVGKEIDEKWKVLRKKYDWDDTMPAAEIKRRKGELKRSYLTMFAEKMQSLSEEPSGQMRLLEMWKNVHGCGKFVNTVVINKRTKNVSIKNKDYYCNPVQPFKIKFDGMKVVIEMSTGGPQYLEINLKTESKGTTKLMFRHRNRK